MAVTHRFQLIHTVEGVRTDVTLAEVYVTRVSDGVEVYGTAAARIPVPRVSAGYYLLDGGAFTEGVAYKTWWRTTKTSGAIVQQEREWTAQAASVAPGAVSTIWAYALWEEQSGYPAQRTMLIQHRGEVRRRITGAHAGDGHSYSAADLIAYMGTLDNELRRLDELIGDDRPAVSLTDVRTY